MKHMHLQFIVILLLLILIILLKKSDEHLTQKKKPVKKVVKKPVKKVVKKPVKKVVKKPGTVPGITSGTAPTSMFANTSNQVVSPSGTDITQLLSTSNTSNAQAELTHLYASEYITSGTLNILSTQPTINNYQDCMKTCDENNNCIGYTTTNNMCNLINSTSQITTSPFNKTNNSIYKKY